MFYLLIQWPNNTVHAVHKFRSQSFASNLTPALLQSFKSNLNFNNDTNPGYTSKFLCIFLVFMSYIHLSLCRPRAQLSHKTKMYPSRRKQFRLLGIMADCPKQIQKCALQKLIIRSIMYLLNEPKFFVLRGRVQHS